MLKIILLLLCVVGTCQAQADFRFYVFDETKTEKLHYEFGQDITIYDFESQDPRLAFYTEYRVYGINQTEFSYTTENYSGDLSPKDYAAFLKQIHNLAVKDLEQKNKGEAGSYGWITLDGKNHTVTATPDKEVRKAWQAVLDELLKNHAPRPKREVSRKTIEGETVKPRGIDFPALLKNPKKYDGKRIRLTGFYHGAFECSSFAATKKDSNNYKQALWLRGGSTFADPKRISGVNDSTITAEGTFILGPGGHMGLWMGELVRLTESQPARANRGGAKQPATQAESK